MISTCINPRKHALSLSSHTVHGRKRECVATTGFNWTLIYEYVIIHPADKGRTVGNQSAGVSYFQGLVGSVSLLKYAFFWIVSSVSMKDSDFWSVTGSALRGTDTPLASALISRNVRLADSAYAMCGMSRSSGQLYSFAVY